MATAEIAYLTSRTLRIIETEQRGFAVQASRFRGEGKDAGGEIIWRTLYLDRTREDAIRLMESFA